MATHNREDGRNHNGEGVYGLMLVIAYLSIVSCFSLGFKLGFCSIVLTFCTSMFEFSVCDFSFHCFHCFYSFVAGIVLFKCIEAEVQQSCKHLVLRAPRSIVGIVSVFLILANNLMLASANGDDETFAASATAVGVGVAAIVTTMTGPSPSNFIAVSQVLLRRKTKKASWNTTSNRRWMSAFGTKLEVCCYLWNKINPCETMSELGSPEYVHLLWALFFLRVYDTEHNCANAAGGVDEKTFRKWSHAFVEAISFLEYPVVGLEVCCILCFALVYVSS